MATNNKKPTDFNNETIVKKVVLDLLEQAYSKRSWHGTNLAGSLRGLTVKQAIWRPARNRHNIWELTIHAAYWKYIVWRKLANKPDSTFAVKGNNWIKSPDNLSEKDWKNIISILGKYHKLLLEAIKDFDAIKTYTRIPNSRLRYIDIILGVAAHDLYHAGQIQLLKRLQK